MKVLSIISIIILFAACDVLDVEPALSVSQDKAIENESDLKKAITGTYDAFQTASLQGRQMVIIPDLLTNSLQWGGTTQEYGEFDFNQLSAENFILAAIWSANYDAINRANFVLDQLPGLSGIEPVKRSAYEAEARFLRGISYFNLVRLFGAVPLREKATLDAAPATLDTPREEESGIWNFILEDLEFAASSLTGNKSSLANPDAAKGFLIKLHIWQQQYDKAVQYATEIISNSQFDLLDNYADLFPDANNSEALFYIEFNEQDQNTIAQYFQTRKEVLPTMDFILSFEDGDERKPVCVDDKNLVNKYSDITTGSDDVYLLRLADIYLLRAEAEVKKGNGNLQDALSDLNEVRGRANLPEAAYDNADDILDAIVRERRIELSFEGHYWFDLIRTGKAEQWLSNVTSPNQLLMPIPLEEINTNGAISQDDQNPGY